jgi:hypothetical protein
MEENLEYWENIRDQRQTDIDCQHEIGNPDRELMNILINGLIEANKKIEELNGQI